MAMGEKKGARCLDLEGTGFPGARFGFTCEFGGAALGASASRESSVESRCSTV